MSVFTRNQSMAVKRGVEAPRLVAAALHLTIPLLTAQLTFGGVAQTYLSQVAEVTPLSQDRMMLLWYLDVYYSVRWAFGMLTQSAVFGFGMGIQTYFVHLILNQSLFITVSILAPGVPAELTTLDWVGAGMAIVAGVLQHGSETQRWLYKRDPRNAGKLHTTGLFGLAQVRPGDTNYNPNPDPIQRSLSTIPAI